MMKFLAAVCLMLLLAGCVAPGDPYSQIAAGNAALQATQQAEISHEREARERSRSATQQAMETAEADRLEIERMNAEAQGTLTALDSQSLRLELGQRAAVETRQSWEAALYITQTMAPVQATQTAQPTMMAAALIRAEARARQAETLANIIPLLGMMALLSLMSLTVILVWYVGSRAVADLKRREMETEVFDRQNGAVVTNIGILQYRNDAVLVDRAERQYPNLNNGMPVAPYVTDKVEIIEPAQPTTDPLKIEAQKLVSETVAGWGKDETDVPGWRELADRGYKWTSPRWQKAIGYLRAVEFIRKEGQVYEFTAHAEDILYRLYSPTPAGGEITE